MRRMKFYPITDIYVDFLHTYDTRVSENCKEEQFPIKKSTEQIECPFCTLYVFYNYLFKNYILLTLHLIVKLKEWFS